MTWKQRYKDAHQSWFAEEYPHAWKDGHYCEPKYPDVRKTNGITTAIINFLTWSGSYGNRINTMGRLVDGNIRTESGASIRVKKWLPSATKKGTADIHGILNGKHISIEIKNAATKDRVRPNQDKERERVTRAGGIYITVTSIEDFFEQYQTLCT